MKTELEVNAVIAQVASRISATLLISWKVGAARVPDREWEPLGAIQNHEHIRAGVKLVLEKTLTSQNTDTVSSLPSRAP